MSVGKALLVAGYFGALGYTVAKSGLDKRIAISVKKGYTSLISYTAEISPPRVVIIDQFSVTAREKNDSADH